MATVLVTGTNRGIGLEFCRQLKQRGHDVIAVCRKASDELKGLDVHIEEDVDVSSEADLKALRQRLESRGIHLSLLINNAGIMRNESLDQMNFDTIREQLEVNSLGPLRVTHSLLPLLKEGSKVAIITSRMGSIADNTSGGRYGYRMSKAAVNMAGMSLSHDLKGQGISVAILHPGFVRTDMTGHNGMIDPQESVGGLLVCIDSLTLDNSGTFWHTNGKVLPW